METDDERQSETIDYGEQDENGVDLASIRENLRLTPTERLIRSQQATASLAELKRNVVRCDASQFHHGRVDYSGMLRRLVTQDVHFVVIGEIAMWLQGAECIATDLDILYDRCDANVARLAVTLSQLRPKLRGGSDHTPSIFDARTLKNGMNFMFRTGFGDLDVFGTVAGVTSFEDLWERADQFESPDFTARVASLDDLIAMKKAANRPKDQFHLIGLEALKAAKEST